jgi:hypothetical protein
MRYPIGHDLTAHAQARMKQRGISPIALEYLFEFGREAFDHHGHVVLYFDKGGRRRLARAAPGRKDVERIARCYAVISPAGEVVTVGHRFRRINRT